MWDHNWIRVTPACVERVDEDYTDSPIAKRSRS